MMIWELLICLGLVLMAYVTGVVRGEARAMRKYNDKLARHIKALEDLQDAYDRLAAPVLSEMVDDNIRHGV